MSLFTTLIIGGWVAFWLYWVASAFGSKKNTVPRIKQFFAIRLVMIALIVILFRIFNIRNYSLTSGAITSNHVVIIVGFIIFLIGLMLAIWARVNLGKNWGMPMTQKVKAELITTGPYRYIRHPIYTGILLAMLGTALASSSFWFLIFAIATLYFIYCALAEERIMLKLFPKTYPAYKRRTKLLIPWVV